MKLPFDLNTDGYEATVIEHPGTKQQCLLQPEALAMYEWIKHTELLWRRNNISLLVPPGAKDAETGVPLPSGAQMERARRWFRKHYPDEFHTLLD